MKGGGKSLIFIIVLLLILIPIISTSYSNCEIYGTCPVFDPDFVMPTNTSVFGNFSFNGGWENNGLSIIDGDLYAQTGYFYNLTSLNITKQNLTILEDAYFLGNVGIGTNSPTDSLHITGTTGDNTPNVAGLGMGVVSNYARIELASGSGSYIDFSKADGTDYKGRIFYSISSNTMTFSTNTAPAILIDSSQRVGIGTTSPQNKLNVIGDGNFTGNLFFDGNNIYDTFVNITGDTMTGALLHPDGTALLPSISFSSYPNLGFYRSANNQFSFSAVGAERFEFGANYIRGAHSYGPVFVNTNPDATTPSFRPTRQDANTGIGNVAYTDLDTLTLIVGGLTALMVRETGGIGYVGIGTLFPQNALNVVGDGNFTGNLTGDLIRGFMSFHNDTVGNVTALTEDTWANFTGFDQVGSNVKLFNGVTYSNNALIIQVAGVYEVEFDATFSGTVNNKYHTSFGIGGVVQQLYCESHDRISTGTDVLGTGCEAHIDLNVGDALTLMFFNEDSGGDATILSAGLNVVRIGN